MGQGGITLTSADYYLSNEPSIVAIRSAYLTSLREIFSLFDGSDEKGSDEANRLLGIETALAKHFMTPVQLTVPENTYHKLTVSDLQGLAPQIDWIDFFSALGIHPEQILVNQPDFVQSVAQLIQSTDLGELKVYLKGRVLLQSAFALGPRYTAVIRQLLAALTGSDSALPRKQDCINRISSLMGDALGRDYVAEYVPPDLKAKTGSMLENVELAFSKTLAAIPWLDDVTRAKAAAKFAKLSNIVGYPDHWTDYSNLVIPADSYISGNIAVNGFKLQLELSRIGHPNDRSRWMMNVFDVNAYYAPGNNQMVFPAGFMWPPNFSPQASDPQNFGAVGMVMGHELTHGYDSSGRQYDGDGIFENWWTPASIQVFSDRAQCLVDQYSQFDVAGGGKVDGRLTLTENIADNGGVKLAYMAMEDSLAEKPRPVSITRYTPEQEFFLASAQMWCQKITPQYEQILARTDVHAPNRYRVNGMLANFPAFAAAFSCPIGAKMAPVNRCAVW